MGKELFDNIPSKVGDLLSDVKNGKVGLPDLQRPYVWKDSKARDLLDSMLKGYPIGYIMLWQSPDGYETINHIGTNDKTYIQPDYLVIDGQQRLTALLAAISGIKVKDKNYSERQIRIAFNPLTREFAVWTEAYERNPEWISGISAVFEADANHDVPKFRRQFIKDCNAGRQKNGKDLLTDEEEEEIETNLNDLLNLSIYTLPTLRINAKATEEDVAEIFVRVNSGGQKLTEKNFIETLLAVYDNDVHDKIDKFCAESRIPKDGTSYVVTKEEMDANLTKFKNALDEVTNLNNWHAFMGLFADLRNVHTADEFVSYLDGVISTRFSDDYFNLTLPADLMSAAATSPAWFGYIAALNVLGNPMLFSTTTLASKLLPGASGDKKAIDKHHIFPKNYLTGIGYTSDRDRNQIANFTYLDYNTNINISDDPPADYVDRYRQKLGEEGYKKTCAENALPVDFEKMSYPDFLEQRRKLMAGIVKKAYQKLCE